MKSLNKREIRRFSYKDELKNPLWKNKRDIVLKRDNYTCQKCGSKDNLHVHHLYYGINRKAWQYRNEELITLCDKCHELEHKDLDALRDIIAEMLLSGFFAHEITNRLNINK